MQAKYLLGSWLCEGRGTQRDFKRGAALLVEAATAGNARASYSLGVLYLEGGQDVDRDLAAAAVWFQKASGLGNLRMSLSGQQSSLTLSCLSCAGMCEASFNLGMLFMQGDGVPRDLQRARECFVLGTQQNEKNDACFVVLKEVDELIAQEKLEKGQGHEHEQEQEQEQRGAKESEEK